MASSIVGSLRTTREVFYGRTSLLLGLLLWVVIVPLILVGLGNPQAAPLIGVYLLYGFAIWLFIFVGNIAYRAHAFGNMVLLGPQQFPRLHAVVEAHAAKLGLKPTPRTFLYNSNGLFNAFARRVFSGRYVFLTSALVEAEDDDQVGFIVGHELGHHAAGHLNGWLTFARFPSHLIPFLMPAYSRAREYTCDQIGAHLAAKPAVSCR